jgi:hypothetical protein
LIKRTKIDGEIKKPADLALLHCRVNMKGRASRERIFKSTKDRCINDISRNESICASAFISKQIRASSFMFIFYTAPIAVSFFPFDNAKFLHNNIVFAAILQVLDS